MPIFNFTITGRVALDPVAIPPFNPSDYGTVSLWLKANALSLNDGDAVATWPDSSGNGNDATQGTAGQRPVYKANILNALPAVRFDGSNDALTGASITSGSLFVVANSTVGASFADYDGLFTLGTSPAMIARASGTNTTLYEIITGLARWRNGVAGIAGVVVDYAPLSDFKLISQTISSPPTGAFQVCHDLAEVGRYWKGDILEIINFTDALNTANRQAVEDALGAKYGITITH